MQHHPRDHAPVGSFGVRIEQAHVSNSVLLVVWGEGWINRGTISDVVFARTDVEAFAHLLGWDEMRIQ